MFNAYVTVDMRNRLHEESVVHVLGSAGTPIAEAPVPLLSETGGVLFWHRVKDGLATVGWRIDRIDAFDEAQPGRVRFNALPKES